jgi:hypothetical protein
LNFGKPKILALSTKAATASGLEMGTRDVPVGDTCNGIKAINTRVLNMSLSINSSDLWFLNPIFDFAELLAH